MWPLLGNVMNSLERNQNLSLNSLSLHRESRLLPTPDPRGRILLQSLHAGLNPQKARRDSNGWPQKICVPEIHLKLGYTAHFSINSNSSRAKEWQEVQNSISFSIWHHCNQKTKPTTKQKNHYAFLCNSLQSTADTTKFGGFFKMVH